MKGLYLLRSARIIVCLIALFGIKFGNYTCVDVSSTVKESELCAKLASPLQPFPRYNENGEMVNATKTGGAYDWEYMKCKHVSLRKFYTSIKNGDSEPDALANTLYSLIIILSLLQLVVVLIELLLVPHEEDQSCLMGLLLILEALFYMALIVIGYLYYFRWGALIVTGTGYSSLFFNVICALFTISQMAFYVDVFFYIRSSCRMQTVIDSAQSYGRKSNMIESQARRQDSFQSFAHSI